MIIKVLFWVFIGIVIYTYVGYGILLFVIIKTKRFIHGTKHTPTIPNDSDVPEITLMICAYNEQDIIEEKMLNCNRLIYPEGKLKIMWVTDGSNDRTNEKLKQYTKITIVFSPERKGKTDAMNHGMKHVSTPLVAFTDANTMLNENALIEMSRWFSDNTIGCVSGEKRVVARTNSDTASQGEGLYWKYESTLKRWDAELYSAMGAAGELYAIRTALYTPPSANTLLDDFIVSMRIVEKGMRIAYTDKAYATEYGSADIHEESKRKRRIAAGGIQSIYMLKKMLNPFHHPTATFQYISHRVLRWTITPFALIAAFLSNIILILTDFGTIYTISGLLQIIFYFSAYYGYMLNKRNIKNKLFYIPYYFVFMNLNVFQGISYLRKKNNSGIWEKAKRG